MGGGQGAGSLIFQIKTVVLSPHQRMPDVEPEGEPSVVPKKLLSLAVRCRKRKNSGPLSPPPKSPLPRCYQRPPPPPPPSPVFIHPVGTAEPTYLLPHRDGDQAHAQSLPGSLCTGGHSHRHLSLLPRCPSRRLKRLISNAHSPRPPLRADGNVK